MNFIFNILNKKSKYAAGFSMIEVIVASSIMAMASISVFQLFIFVTRSTKTIYNNSTALNIATLTIDQVQAAGPLKFPKVAVTKVTGLKNTFNVETRIQNLTYELYLVEVKVSYKEDGREVSTSLASLVEE